MLKKRKKEKLGLRAKPQWRSPRHLRHVRGHHCPAEGIAGHVCEGIMEAMHTRVGTDGNKKEKPSDYYAAPGCSGLHREQHNKSEQYIEKKYGFSMLKLAQEACDSSPCRREIIEWKAAHPLEMVRSGLPGVGVEG